MSPKEQFYKKLKEIESTRNVSLSKAFIFWYISAMFGDTNFEVTDGPRDGGIDAIVRPRRVGGAKLVYILQSKYTEKFFRRRPAPPLDLKSYLEFDTIPRILRSDKMYEDWLQDVDAGLRSEYQLLRKDFLNESNVFEWRLVTLYSRSRRGENRLQNLGPDSFQYGSAVLELFEMEREGATPPGDPLELTFKESMTIEDSELGYVSYVLAADLDGFIDYLDNDLEGKLFARNVRLDLRTEINRTIKETYVKQPHEFWYSHNGITLICSNATIRGNTIRLINPSVINGSQTLNALARASKSKRGRGAKVLTRILVVPGGDVDTGRTGDAKKFVNDIIFRTNQQNKMYAYDLRANDIQQVSLARQFMQNGVFYERRRGEWHQRRRAFKNQGVEKLNCVELAQILAAFDPKVGVAVAKKAKEDLFRVRYRDIFYKPFPRIYLAFKLFRFVRHVLARMSYYKTTPRMRRHALFTVASIAHDIVAKSGDHRRLISSVQFSNFIETDSTRSKNLEKLVRKVFVDCWQLWRRENRKDPTLSPNNFFKSERWNSELRKKLVRKYSRKGRKAIHAIFS